MNSTIRSLAAVLTVTCSFQVNSQQLSTAAGPNINMVTPVSPAAPTASTLPFPDTVKPATTVSEGETEDRELAKMRAKLAAEEEENSKPTQKFPDRTSYGQSQSQSQSQSTAQSSSRKNSTQEEMTTTEQALLDRVSPMSPEAIKEALQARDGFSASANQPVINSVPKTSSQTISLSTGSAMPVVRVAPGRPTYIVFEDITGAPWPLALPVVNSAGDKNYYVRSFTDTPIVLVQPLVTYGNGDIGVILKDLPIPITLVLANVEPNAKDKTHVYDSRINLRIPRRGPLAPAYSITSISKITLSSPELQSLLDGIAPTDAIRLKTDSSKVTAWKRGNKLYLRTSLSSKTQFSKTLSSADGTHVYEMELSPFVAMMDEGSTVTVKVEF